MIFGGAGFIRHMIDSYKANKALLRRNREETFKPFDKAYITDSIISRKPPKYNKSTPAMLQAIRMRLAHENRTKAKQKLAILLVSAIISSMLFFWLFWLY